jgi:hypothetical protein
MDLNEILHAVRALDGVLVLAPDAGSEFPEISWGDFFFYYAPDGEVPLNTQPFATIVTKDYPDDEASRLDGVGRWRVNIHVGQAKVAALTEDASTDLAEADVIRVHPVYGAYGWVCVVNPGERTEAEVRELLGDAHEDARRRFARRAGS